MTDYWQQIQDDFVANRSIYEDIKRDVTKRIQGRCPHHRVLALNIAQRMRPVQTYLEVGVLNGLSMSYMVNQPNPLAAAIGIDLFEDTIDRYKHDNLALEKARSNIESNNTSGTPVHLLKGNSNSAAIREEVQRMLSPFGGLDLLFLDGDHSYEGIKADFTWYSQLVKPGGTIILDDYGPAYPGIQRFVEESILSNPAFSVLGTFTDYPNGHPTIENYSKMLILEREQRT